MFDIGSSELLLIIIVAVVVIGPKDLPRVLYKLGQILGKGRAMTRHFRSGIDEMIRQAEMEELEKKWAADNARIMAQTPVTDATANDGNDVVAVADGETPLTLPGPDAPILPAQGVGTAHVDAVHESDAVNPADDGFKSFVAAPSPKPESGSAT